jgi:hypothetical protein
MWEIPGFIHDPKAMLNCKSPVLAISLAIMLSFESNFMGAWKWISSSH